MVKNTKILSKLTSPLALLIFAIVLAGLVAWVAYYYLQQREASMKAEIAAKGKKNSRPMVSVVVPKADAKVNTVLNQTNFVARKVEEDLVYPDTLLAKDFPGFEGQKLARPVLHGRAVRLTDLQAPEVKDVSSILPLGSRALTIEIDNLNSIAQTLRPSHRIDLFLISKAPKPAVGTTADASGQPQDQASLFMQDMVVLATGKDFQDVSGDVERAAKAVRPGEVEGAREKGFDTITLLVNSAQAARLLVGQKLGTFRVALRGSKDHDAVNLKPLRSADLLPPDTSKKSRDGGIEFIVGGRGEKLISRLALPPSQELNGGAQQPPVAPIAAPGPRTSGPTPEEINRFIQSTNPGAANQPIPALRGK
jgi:pilus assembly protein CpaB